MDPPAPPPPHAQRAFVGLGTHDRLVDLEVLHALAEIWAGRGTGIAIRACEIPHVVSIEEAGDISDWIFEPECVESR